MEIKNILVPMSGAAHSRDALIYGIFFAKKLGTELSGVYVKDIRFIEGPWFNAAKGFLISEPYFPGRGNVSTALDERGSRISDHFLSVCRNAGIRGAFDVEKGLVSDVIVRKAETADMVIIGKRDEHSAWLGKHVGSVCRRIIRHLNKPFLVIDHLEPKEIKKVLLCHRGDEFAQKSIDMTRKIIQATGFSLTVLTINPDMSKSIQAQQDVRRYFSSFSIKAQYVFTAGCAEKALIKVMAERKIDMLIVEAEPRKIHEDSLFHGVTGTVLHDTVIPVLFVR